VWRGIADGVKKTIRLHRIVAETPTSMVTDHLNHDRLDNRKSNLRVCIQASNAKNRSTADRGYCWDKSKDEWIVRIGRKFYGRYELEQDAIRAVQLSRSGVPYSGRERRPKYHLPLGVFRNKGTKGYQAKAQIDGQRYYLGIFPSAEEASNAYQNIILEKKQ
jgi:hypothetical protein